MSELRFTHDPKDQPTDCLDSVLHELAFRGNLTALQRRETFEHGERALRELQPQVAEARAWARAYAHDPSVFDTSSSPDWLTAPVNEEGPSVHRPPDDAHDC